MRLQTVSTEPSTMPMRKLPTIMTITVAFSCSAIKPKCSNTVTNASHTQTSGQSQRWSRQSPEHPWAGVPPPRVPGPKYANASGSRRRMAPLSHSDPVLRFVRQRQRFVRRCQGRDPGHTGIRAGRGPLALRCGDKPHRRAERPLGRSIPWWVLFVHAKDLFITAMNGKKPRPLKAGAS